MCVFLYFSFRLFSRLFHSLFFSIYRISLSLSLAHFLLSHRAFRFSPEKKSKKLAHSRLLGLSLTNLLFTLRLFCFSFFFLLFNADYYIALDFDSLSLSHSQYTQYSFFFFSSFYIFPRHSLTLFVTSRSPTRARISHTLSLSFSLSAIVTHVLPLVSSYRLTLFLSLSFCVPFLRVSRSIHLCLERHATSRANRRERRMSSILLLVFNLLFVFFPPLLRTTRVFT